MRPAAGGERDRGLRRGIRRGLRNGPRDEGAVEPADIVSIERTVMRPFDRPDGLDAAPELAVVYAVHVRRNRLPWLLHVDPQTGALLGQQAMFFD